MTMAIDDMLGAYPADLGRVDRDRLTHCIEEATACAQACTACADACLSEADVSNLAKCIRTNLDCADICQTTARVLSRHTGYDANITRAQLLACAAACHACADECGRQSTTHEHCWVCAEACRRCERACEELINTLG
ncbi:four-helix bundle copper-binding protein [Streptomyces litchfieldiae]|uniref:Four-helix bundle copper-binding protein n=1 Tax=Streptomyces litchfieldiae TaxID=3075543 RepID=A0ABU2MYL6_9ACTN|nr:four-helix bundle copper-binding protein [Streptomyces sp. DSM 44938]MDT0346714.1 four-helix bundle copper-binding protein [Streptomyces sp. DSM 44938]